MNAGLHRADSRRGAPNMWCWREPDAARRGLCKAARARFLSARALRVMRDRLCWLRAAAV